MEDAWQSQDIAPSGISIPTDAGGGGPPSGDAWSSGAGANGGDADRDGDRDRDRDNGEGRGEGRGGGRRWRRTRQGVGGDAAGVGALVGMGRRGEWHNPGNNLHVSGLSHKIDTRDLEAAFAKIGRVKKASVMYDPHTRESRGFGFVTMETPEEAEAAVAALNGTDMGGKTVNVEKARRGRARTPTPGRYYGPPKRGDNERPYDPRPYDSRYSRDHDDRGGRGGGGRDYRGGGGGGGGRDEYRGGRGRWAG
ncbi:putative RNA-binding protein C25G10.01 [Mycena venus]|uniref:Putative RNA-binding protein C25G10.01 n=1 Tax=Mycena venus TaxID=2733690 RepID=A0A8H7D8K5_9AGAR|nr:putative RNA-binding protein C25G10.01 [Mycena venus]